MNEWPPELNISSFTAPPRPGWRKETVELLQKISAACRLFRDGMTPAAALNLTRAVYAAANLSAVGVGNWQTTLAFVGPALDGEPPHQDRVCPAVQLCLETGKVQTCRRANEISILSNCWMQPPAEDDANTPNWLVATPLENDEEIIGVLTVYGSELFPLHTAEIELARWVALEANANLELGRLKGSAGQLAEAELKALRAQISPHFLFNTLNTIAALVRIDAEEARELIVDFASFFRRTLKHHGEFVTLSEELDYVQRYVRFEQIRFGKALSVSYDIAPGTEMLLLPVLTIQPLVENAINHGVGPKIGGGHVHVATQTVEDGDVLITVEDDGVGITADAIKKLFRPKTGSGKGLGMALVNIKERLQKLFGVEYELKVESTPDKGTRVMFRVPRLRRS